MVSLLFSPFGETVFNDGCFFSEYVQKFSSKIMLTNLQQYVETYSTIFSPRLIIYD